MVPVKPVVPSEILERAGIDEYNINYAKKVVHLTKKDLLRLLGEWDESFFVPVAVSLDGWTYTAEVNFDYLAPRG